MYLGLTMLGRQMHTAEPLILEPSHFQVENAAEKLKRYTWLGINQIPNKMIQAKSKRTVFYDSQKDSKMYCDNYQQMSLLSATYNSSLYILLIRFNSVCRWCY
jgi:hypothetical protein